MKLFMKVIHLDPEELEKGKALPIGTRRIHGKGKNAMWTKKVSGGKWVYDGMVTSADVKAAESEERRRKLAAKMAAAHEEVKKKAQSTTAVSVYADKPTAAELATKPKKVQLYWDDSVVNDSKRELADITGILCLDDGSEEYVRKNLGTIFEMSKEQKLDFEKANGMFPLGTDGKPFEDPYFMDQAIDNIQKLYDDVSAGKFDDRIKDFMLQFDYQGGLADDAYALLKETLAQNVAEGRGMTVGHTTYDYVKSYLERVLNELKSYNNNKIVMGKIRDMDKTYSAMIGIDTIGSALLAVTFGDQIRNKYGNLDSIRAWDKGLDPFDGKDQFSRFLASCGVGRTFYQLFAIDGSIAADMLGMLLHTGMSEYVKAWFRGRCEKQGLKFDEAQFDSAVQTLRNNNKLLSKIITDYYKLDGAYPSLLDMELRSEFSLQTGSSSYRSDGGIVFDVSKSVGDLGVDLRNFLRSRAAKKAIEDPSAITHAYGPTAIQKILSVADATKKLGNVPFDSLEGKLADESIDLLRTLSHGVRDSIGLSGNGTGLENALREHFHSGWGQGAYETSVFSAISDVASVSNRRVFDYTTYTARASARKGWSGWAFNRHKHVPDDFTTNKVIKNVLSHGVYNIVGVLEGGKQKSLQNHLNGTLSYAMGMNYHLMQLSKKSKVLPSWDWNKFVIFGKNNPVGFAAKRYSGSVQYPAQMETADFQSSIRDVYNKSVAINMGFVAKKAGADPKITLKSVDQQKFKDLQKRLDDTWTHGGKSYVSAHGMKLNHAFEINQHDYYPEYKKLEQQLGNVKYMYHGTDFQAGSKIMKGGYKVFSRAKAGRMLGDGIYFADSCSKSGSYMHSPTSRSFSSGNHGVLLWNRVVLGKVTSGKNTSEWYQSGYDTNYGDVDAQYGGKSDCHTGLRYSEMLVRGAASAEGSPMYKAVPIEWLDCEMI